MSSSEDHEELRRFVTAGEQPEASINDVFSSEALAGGLDAHPWSCVDHYAIQ